MAEESEYCLLHVKEKGVYVLPISALSFNASESAEVEIKGEKLTGEILYKGSKQRCLRRAQLMKLVSRAVSAVNMESIEDKTLVPGNEEDENAIEESERRQRIIAQVLLSILSPLFGNDGDEGDAHAATCDACNRRTIRGDRYKCLQCHDYDLCGYCFERGEETMKHRSGHAFAHFKIPGELFGEAVRDVNEEITLEILQQRFAEESHAAGTECGACNNAIIGLRFKCDVCPHFNLCLSCWRKKITTKTHLLSHSLIVIGKDALQQISIDDIELGDELGRGAFGAVFKAKWLSKKIDVACKLISLPPDEKRAETLEKSFRKELAAYAELSGAYIVKTYGYGERTLTNGTRQFMLVMEFMEHGSLRHLLKTEKLSIRRKLEIAANVASGMRKLHAHQMIHRDIRPDNILVNHNYHAKIGDMGIARDYQPNLEMTQIGCQKFMPPEFYAKKYDQSLDIFTFGLTLSELFTGADHSLAFNLKLGCPKIIRKTKSPVFEELIERCLRNDTKHRPSAIEVEATLLLYLRAFSKLITSKYVRMDAEGRNKVFLDFYEEFHPQASEQLAKRFPLPPPLTDDEKAEEATDVNVNPVLMLLFKMLQDN